MGAGIATKVRDEQGQEKFVRLTGAEKAVVYRMLANFGIYEQDVPPSELTEAERKVEGTPLEKREAISTPKFGSINASTMHCCEAAEIVFEDIT